MSAFRIGQKVVCVDDAGWANYANSKNRPYRGCTYTVASIDGEYIGLEEVFPWQDGRDSSSYLASRFRPVVERKTETGMAILREILDRESHHDRAPALNHDKHWSRR